MKKLLPLSLSLSAMLNAVIGISQWTDVSNREINWEIQVAQDYYGASDDGAGGPAEPTVKPDVYVEGTGFLGQSCYWYSAYPGGYNYDNWGWWAGDYAQFNTQFGLYLTAYESDNGDACTYTSGDDDYWEGWGVLRDGAGTIPFTYPSTDFYPCGWNQYLGNGGSSWVFNQIYDEVFQLTWRYYYGYGIGDCLNFNDITGTTKSDVNSNRQVSTVSGYPLQYSNTIGNASADVWYAFNITSRSTVTISTANTHTNFDTYLRLYTATGTELMTNDDSGANNTSVISTQLCPGTYKFCVEGYGSNSGVFQVTASATPIPAMGISITDTGVVPCEDDNTGYATWNVLNTAGAYSVYLNGSNLGQVGSAYDLSVGSYNISVTDACGVSASTSFNIISGDNTPPVASCNSDLTVVVYPNQASNISVEDVNFGSYDNCNIQWITIDESNFTASEAGLNVVELTVTDYSGNSSTCTTNVFVQVGVGVEEELALTAFEIIPNPNNGRFRLSLNADVTLPDTYYEIHDLTGRMVLNSRLSSATQELDMQDASPGVYFITIEQQGAKTTRRFVIE